RDHQDAVIEGDLPADQGSADHLVDRIVPADVLSKTQKAAIEGEEARGVETSGPSEDDLPIPEIPWERGKNRGAKCAVRGEGVRSGIRERLRARFQGVDAGLPAQTAGRARQERAHDALPIDLH